MKFDLLSKEVVKEVRAKDSLDYYASLLKFTDHKVMYDTISKRALERVDVVRKRESSGERIGSHQQAYLDKLKSEQPMIDQMVRDMKVYLENPDALIGQHLKCKYTIENPMLNNAKQEIDRTFYYSLRNGQVLRSL